MTPEERRHMEKMFEGLKKDLKLGPTGQFPEGKIHRSDQGQLSMAIGHKDGKVFITFGVATDWIGFTKEQALQLATTLVNHASEL